MTASSLGGCDKWRGGAINTASLRILAGVAGLANAKIVSMIDAEVTKTRREILLNVQTIEHTLFDAITTLTERVDQLREDVDKLMQR
jgi:hypothetical protein